MAKAAAASCAHHHGVVAAGPRAACSSRRAAMPRAPGGAAAMAPPRHRRALPPHQRVTKTRVATTSSSASTAGGSSGAAMAAMAATASAAAQCPFTALREQLGVGVGSAAARGDEDAPPIPGPAPFSAASLRDVGDIFLQGLHVAMLGFEARYGPISRFANPAQLNGATSWVFVNDPDVVAHVCGANVKNYARRYLPDVYRFVTHEKGLLGSQGEYNARHRRLCQPAFKQGKQLERFADVVVERANRLADIWAAHLAAAPPPPPADAANTTTTAASTHAGRPAMPTDLATAMQRLALDVVGLTAFSHDFKQVQRCADDLAGRAGDSTQATDRLLWAVNTFGETLAQVFITPMPLLRLLHALGLPHLRNLDAAVGVMRGAMLGVIAERRAALAAAAAGSGGAGGAGAGVPQDLLSVLLGATDDDGRAMSDEELWEDIHDVMGAGHETTATTAAAVLYCIAAHPPVERRLLRELRDVLGGAPPGYADLERLPYLAACVKEAMRLYPAIPVFPREAAAADVLPTGHAIQAGDVVFMSSFALGRSPRLWDNPLSYDPSRFAPDAAARLHRFQFLPFGAGSRMCLGSSFAQMSVSLMVATLLRRFAFEPVAPSSPLIPVGYDITMNFAPTHGLHMRVRARDAPAAELVAAGPMSSQAAAAAVVGAATSTSSN